MSNLNFHLQRRENMITVISAAHHNCNQIQAQMKDEIGVKKGLHPFKLYLLASS